MSLLTTVAISEPAVPAARPVVGGEDRSLDDAAQLAPHRAIDIAAPDVDNLALSAHELPAPFGATEPSPHASASPTPLATPAMLSLAADHAGAAADAVAEGSGRRWALLHRDEQAEVWAIAWPAGTGLGMHDHDDARAAVVVVQGRLRERYVGRDGQLLMRWLTAAVPVVLPSDHAHEVRNVDTVEAVSVHVYSPPQRRVRPLDEVPLTPVRCGDR